MNRIMTCFLGALIVCTSGCSRRTGTSLQTDIVKLDTVHRHGGELFISYPAKIVAAKDANLAFRVSGPIRRIPVEIGQHVRKGELVAEIDPRDYEIQLAATEAEYDQIKNEAERVFELYKRGSATQSDRDKAYYGLKQITAKLNAHRNALHDTRLVAPFNGYIQKKFFEANETVSAGMPIIAMIGRDEPEVEINIPASDYIRRSQFDSFSCTVDVLPGEIFPLELIGVAQKANLNQLYNVRFRIGKQPDTRLTAGMNATVSITYSPDEGALTIIPLTAVFDNNGKSSVWIYDPESETITSREVRMLEIRRDGSVVIAEETLHPGELIVSAGVHSLKEGQQVTPLEPIAETNVGGML